MILLQPPTYILLELHIISISLIIYKPSTLIISPQTFSTQLGAGTSLFRLSQCAIPFCTPFNAPWICHIRSSTDPHSGTVLPGPIIYCSMKSDRTGAQTQTLLELHQMLYHWAIRSSKVLQCDWIPHSIKYKCSFKENTSHLIPFSPGMILLPLYLDSQ